MRPAALTLLALVLGWTVWQVAAWAQGMAGLDWLGLAFPGAVLLLALSQAARWLDRH